MHVEIVVVAAIRRRRTLFFPRIVPGYARAPDSLTICASCSLDERLESACMLNSARLTFRESSRIVPRILMVTERQGGYHPSEFQGLKGWRRRWIHSAITYI